MKEKMIEVKW